jgi:hypothetical protein
MTIGDIWMTRLAGETCGDIRHTGLFSTETWGEARQTGLAVITIGDIWMTRLPPTETAGDPWQAGLAGRIFWILGLMYLS